MDKENKLMDRVLWIRTPIALKYECCNKCGARLAVIDRCMSPPGFAEELTDLVVCTYCAVISICNITYETHDHGCPEGPTRECFARLPNL